MVLALFWPIALLILLPCVVGSKLDQTRSKASLTSKDAISSEFQNELYDRFLKKGAQDELNLPSRITKPIHLALGLQVSEYLPEFLEPVYQEVVKMVLINTFQSLRKGKQCAKGYETKINYGRTVS